MKIFEDFAKFINRGNVVDMAVGVVVGGAFGKIVTSLVADIITPCITYVTGGAKNAGKVVLKAAELAEDGVTVAVPEVAINYGNFVQTIVDFVIIAFCIFIVVKAITSLREKAAALKKKEEEPAPAPAPEPEPSEEAKLLTEIVEILKNK